MESFDIPIVLFFFKRTDKTLLVLEQIAKVRPNKLYLISDGPRYEAEISDIEECRRRIEAFIDWPCHVVKNYAEINKGVFDRIGLGAQWVLQQEIAAIFLEDDNVPEVSFFPFCKDMLRRYEDDTRVLWVCGTNYLKEYQPADGSSYVFTRHMLPCGWASWSHKFGRFYEADLALCDDQHIQDWFSKIKDNQALLRQHMECWRRERRRILSFERASSWDHQMSFTLQVHGLFGIVPKYNQICNIGVDEHSIHGGTSFSNIMTRRFCGLPTRQLEFPLLHPKVVALDFEFERLTGNIILLPLRYRIKGFLNKFFKRILSIPNEKSLIEEIKSRLNL